MEVIRYPGEVYQVFNDKSSFREIGLSDSCRKKCNSSKMDAGREAVREIEYFDRNRCCST